MNSSRTVARWVLTVGLFLIPLGCDRDETSGQPAPARPPEPAARKLVAVASEVTSSPSPSQPAREGLAAFEQIMARKLDPSQVSTRAASSAGGILHIPNGHAAHASILVRGPDGQLRSACVSSPVEVSALV